MRAAPFALFAALSLAGGSVRAEAPPPPSAKAVAPPASSATHVHVAATLDLSHAADLDHCPTEQTLRHEVSRRIGYDPFARDADGSPFGKVRVTIARSPKGLVATYAHEDPKGALQWSRTYEVPGPADADACDLVFAALGAFLAIELSAFANELPPSPAEPGAPSPSPLPKRVEITAPPPSPPRPSIVRGEAGIGAFLGGGTGPGLAAGGALQVGLAVAPFDDPRSRLSFSGEARIHAPHVENEIRSRLYTGSLLACFLRDWISGPQATFGGLACATGTAGFLDSTKQALNGPVSLTSRASYVALGARLGLETRLGAAVILRIHGQVLPALHGARVLGPGGRTAAGTSAVAGDTGLTVLVPF
ncbi:Hypothetical protein A7982_05987 [Minicystis rosea]|nr:Hypothetical protein A7982_05987 [Minicystis rosea]